jgi:hypothetical protein
MGWNPFRKRGWRKVGSGLKKGWRGTKRGINKGWRGTRRGINKGWKGLKSGVEYVGDKTHISDVVKFIDKWTVKQFINALDATDDFLHKHVPHWGTVWKTVDLMGNFTGLSNIKRALLVRDMIINGQLPKTKEILKLHPVLNVIISEYEKGKHIHDLTKKIR